MSSSLADKLDDEWLLTPERAAIHRPTGTAVIADLHLGYDHVRRRSGEAIPEVSAHEGLVRLEALATSYAVRRLIVAGDLCENRRCTGPLTEWLRGLSRLGIELAGVVPGNHDRGLDPTVALPIHTDGITLGRWRVVHGDGALPRGRVIHGHWHPCLRWSAQIAAPCFLTRRARLVLPAFSTDAAGVNVLNQKDWCAYRCRVVVGTDVLDFGELSRLKVKRRKAQSDRQDKGLAP